MKIIVEKDKKKDIGYQVSVIEGPVMKVYRGTPDFMDLVSSCQIARQLLEEYNRRFGTHYRPEECIGIDEEAFKANANRDINAARGWQEIQSRIPLRNKSQRQKNPINCLSLPKADSYS